MLPWKALSGHTDTHIALTAVPGPLDWSVINRSHQKDVSVHDVTVTGRYSLDLSFFDELAGRRDDVHLTSQTLVDVNQLPKLLLSITMQQLGIGRVQACTR